MDNKKDTKETPAASAPAATSQVVTAPTASVQAIPATAPNRTLMVRFALAKASANAKAPIARCSVHLDGAMRGMVLDVPIFRAKDGNGVSAAFPGGGFPALKAAPLVVTIEGVEFETTASDHDGKQIEDQLLPLIVDAYGKWQITKQANQAITFAG